MRNTKINFLYKIFSRVCVMIIVLLIFFCFTGCSQGGGPEKKSDQTATDTIIEAPKATSADLFCLEFNTFSGAYVEDGKNEEVENVAAILVENRSELFLDKATIKYKYGDETATFLVTGLPSKSKCWVMESGKLELDGKSDFEFEDCVSAFKEDAVIVTDKLLVDTNDNKVTIKNISDQTLNNVCIYYKNTMDDGSFFGGITYMMSFGNLEPDESFAKESGHYSENSKIVRFSFQEV